MPPLEIYETWGEFYESIKPMIVGKWKGLGGPFLDERGFDRSIENYRYLTWDYNELCKRKYAKEVKRNKDGIHFTIEGRNILVKDKSFHSDNPKHRFYVVFGPDKARGSTDVAVALFPLSSFLWDIAEDVPSDSFSVTAPVYLYDRPETHKWENLALSRLKLKVREMADEHTRMITQSLVTEIAVCSLCRKSRPTAELHKVNPNYFFCQDTCWNKRGKILGSKYAGALNCPFYNEGMCNVDSDNTCSLSYGSYNTTCFVYRIGKTRRF